MCIPVNTTRNGLSSLSRGSCPTDLSIIIQDFHRLLSQHGIETLVFDHTCDSISDTFLKPVDDFLCRDVDFENYNV